MVVRTLSLVQKDQTRGCSGCSMQWNSVIWWWGHCLWYKKVKPVDAVYSGIVVYGGGDIVLWCKKVKPVDTVCSGHSGIVIYGGGDIVFGAKRSNQWTQWTQYSDIWWWGHCLSCRKVKPEDAVDAVCSGIMVYGGGDIVFGAKRSNQWIQWIQSHSGHSTCDCIHWFDLFAPYTTIPLHTASTASSGLTFLHQDNVPTTIYHYSTVYCVLHTAYCVHCILWFDPFVSKTMSPPPYNTILLCPLHTASTVYCVYFVTASTESTGLTYLYQRQCPHHHISLFYCVLHTAYCICCILWFDIFVSKTMSPPPYTTILLCPLRTVSTASTVYCVHCVTASTESTGLIYLYQRQCLHHLISLFYCVYYILRPLHPLCTVSTV